MNESLNARVWLNLNHELIANVRIGLCGHARSLGSPRVRSGWAASFTVIVYQFQPIKTQRSSISLQRWHFSHWNWNWNWNRQRRWTETENQNIYFNAKVELFHKLKLTVKNQLKLKLKCYFNIEKTAIFSSSYRSHNLSTLITLFNDQIRSSLDTVKHE